jgi:hypothetical protein
MEHSLRWIAGLHQVAPACSYTVVCGGKRGRHTLGWCAVVQEQRHASYLRPLAHVAQLCRPVCAHFVLCVRIRRGVGFGSW